MSKIGFSTGCMYHTKVPLLRRVLMYKELGLNAIELSFVDSLNLDKFYVGKFGEEQINKFNMVTLHAPWHTENHGTYDEVGLPIIKKLKTLGEKLKIDGIVFHPDKFKDYKMLEESKLPVLIENMDKRKKVGIDTKYFDKVKQDFDFGFVLNVQHAYEHDSSMKFADELINCMGERLKHAHVSGQDTQKPYHSLVHCAHNHKEITNTLAKLKEKSIPIILEGVVTYPIFDNMKKEVNLMKEIYGN